MATVSMGRVMKIPPVLAVLAACALCAISPAAWGDPAVPLAPAGAAQGAPNGLVELDRDGDGRIDYRVNYDQRGNVASEELDFNFDGVMDTFYYYKAGILQRVEIDSKNNGRIDIWVYLIDGVYVQRYERDTDGDGKPDLVRDFGGE